MVFYHKPIEVLQWHREVLLDLARIQAHLSPR